MYKIDKKFKSCVISFKGVNVLASELTQEQMEILYDLGHVGITLTKKRKPKKLDNAAGEPLPIKPEDE